MKLYTTPPSIQTLVIWVPQSNLAFDQAPHVGWPLGLRPSAITILQCAASLAALQSPARCLIGRPYADSSKLSYSTVVINILS